MASQVACPGFTNRQRKHHERPGEMREGGHRQSVVPSRHALSKDAVHSKPEGACHGNRVAFDGCRMRGNAVFGYEHNHSGKSDQHSNDLMSSRSLKPEKNRKHQNVDGTQADDHRGMADAREMQANREAHLIDRHAKETKVNKNPEIPRYEPTAPKFGRFRKRP